MTIFALGSVNTAALSVPGNYVAIVPPQIQYINGVPTGVLGIVGTASWGPVDAPTTIGTYAEYQQNFGPLIARRYDMGTPVAIAVQQGASAFQCVRVTDGTDTAATNTITNGQIQSVFNLVGGTGYSTGLARLIHGITGIRWRVSSSALITFRDWVSRPTHPRNRASHTRRVRRYPPAVRFPIRRAQESDRRLRRRTHHL